MNLEQVTSGLSINHPGVIMSQPKREFIIWQSRTRNRQNKDSKVMTCHSLGSAVYWCRELPYSSFLWIEPVRVLR